MKVLFFVPSFASGGAEAFIVNLMEKINKTKYELELLCINNTPGIYCERLDKMGVKIQVLDIKGISNPAVRYFKAYRAFSSFISKNHDKYEVIHFCLAQGEDLPFVHLAKKVGIPVRILHSHNSSVNSSIKYVGHVLCKCIYKYDATDFLACSDLAAKWLLPKKVLSEGNYRVIKNGIDAQKYKYNVHHRTEKRNELQADNRPIFLNIGRLNHQKNQSFLIDVFYKICEIVPDSLLLVAGEGSLREALENRTKELGLTDKVYWLGNRNDIPQLLSAADVFLLPSLYEGLPYTIVEAQASGIECVISDTISKESVLTDLVSCIPLDAEKYAYAAVSALKKSVEVERTLYAHIVREAGFDICNVVSEIEEIYDKVQ